MPWADAEIELLRLGLRSHGNNWEKISTTLPEKTPEQCKKYFYSMRKKLQLDKIVHEYKKVKLGKFVHRCWFKSYKCKEEGRK